MALVSLAPPGDPVHLEAPGLPEGLQDLELLKKITKLDPVKNWSGFLARHKL